MESASRLRAANLRETGDVRLLCPPADASDPELSIVIPALNEELTVGLFVDWCKEGLERAGAFGEVLIVDSSRDKTAEIALAHGARVLCVPKRGLGRAYIDALPYIRGQYVLMGDADCTYDFRELAPFLEKLRAGYEYVMGSRFRGYIEPRAMPALHRYLGTPVTTWLLNLIYGTHFSDIHCGMRGMTTEALQRMDLASQSWEYASEMVLKSVQLELRTSEVPVRFLRDRDGRQSHHKRAGWLSPWKAAWINLQAMFENGADFFLFRPGLTLLAIGVAMVLASSGGPLTVGPVTLSIYWSLLGLTLAVVGLQSFFLACLARVLYDRTGKQAVRWTVRFPYTRTCLLSGGLLLAGLGLTTPLVQEYLQSSLRLKAVLEPSRHLAITGLFCVISAFMTFTFLLVLRALANYVTRTHQNRG
ncbi:MAG: glycosyltransferase family 2 protein [Acidobacteriia bacterium]|nr:glycosyltransferase family 2 protein [Terriglobia bacterium]